MVETAQEGYDDAYEGLAAASQNCVLDEKTATKMGPQIDKIRALGFKGIADKLDAQKKELLDGNAGTKEVVERALLGLEVLAESREVNVLARRLKIFLLLAAFGAVDCGVDRVTGATVADNLGSAVGAWDLED
jgi:hypothetical protein